MTTNRSPTQPGTSSIASRWSILLAGGALVAAGLIAYANSFSAPFVFDDLPAIRDNETIRTWSRALFPPRASGLPVSGRPVVNFSFAVNYAVSGSEVWSYHVMNAAIHLVAVLMLFGIVRRTLLQPALREQFRQVATQFALLTALLWALHPLQIESVTYMVQRAESLMGLFYLLTLYAFIRGTQEAASRAWHAVAVASCALGMASKEVMASAPLMVLLYDRTFVSGSFRAAWRRHRTLYAGLAATWLLLGWLVLGGEGRGGTAGFATDVAWWAYAAAQFPAIVRYLGLAVWPQTLVLDYGAELDLRPAMVVACAALVLTLVAATIVLLRRRPAVGFLGAWFFAILAPSSSVVPIATQAMAEHRMYLPLAAVAVLIVLAAQRWLARWSTVGVVVFAAALMVRTVMRNEDYRSAMAIWTDTVANRPENPRAHCNLGDALFLAGDTANAIAHYEAALRLKPDYGEAHYNLANTLLAAGRAAEAVPHYEAALRLQPRFAKAQRNLANALAGAGRAPEALIHFMRAAELEPGQAETECGWADVLTQLGREGEAVGHYEAALRARPDYAEAHNNLGIVLANAGDFARARGHFEAALRARPDYAAARDNLERLRAIGH